MLIMFNQAMGGVGEWTADAFPWVSYTVSDITLGRTQPGATPVMYVTDVID